MAWQALKNVKLMSIYLANGIIWASYNLYFNNIDLIKWW